MIKRTHPMAIVLAAYLAAALAYIVITPPWQAADEPAHFNYVRHLVDEASLPVLRLGDYPADYLEELKAARFPEGSDVSPIRYESHQPPLYYVLAAPVLAAFAGDPLAAQVHALRLFTVATGAAALFVAYALGLVLWPGRRERAAALAAAVGLIPMHTSVSASVNNDVLGEVLAAAVVLLILRALIFSPTPSRERLAALGILVGLCLLTKTTAYISVPLVLIGLLLHRHLFRRSWSRLARPAMAIALPAALLWTPWVARNLATYGLSDPLGLARHDSIVVGQPTTAELLAFVSPVRLIIEGVTTTFRSFWGVFGWMGVPMHEQVYLLLAVVTATAIVGLLIAAWRPGFAAPAMQAVSSRRRWAPVVLCAAWGLFSILGLLWYNMKFVQHQGRYLFAALPVWASAMLVGLAAAREHPGLASAALATLGAAVGVLGWARGDVPGMLLALLAAAAAGLHAWRWMARRWSAASALPLVALWGLSLAGALYYVNRFL